jgi:ribonuclease P protein component
VVGRLVHKADFEQVLASRSLRRSAHFALHHVPNGPQDRKFRRDNAAGSELSTGVEPTCSQPVDDLVCSVVPSGLWLGCVVPKRHARRAVTRTLLKRQIRAAFDRHAGALSGGMWLVRLRAPFSATEFVSARSVLLAAAARTELDRLLVGAAV